MRIQFSALGDALIDHVTGIVAHFLKEDDDQQGATATQEPLPATTPAPDIPDVSYLRDHFAEAIGSFYATIARITADNPVDMEAFLPLAAKAGADTLTANEAAQFKELKLAAQRQGRAVGAVMGFFLKFNPYPMFAEVRAKEALFQPAFGPILVANGDAVRDVLSRHHEFTVDPYGVQMSKSMSPQYNGGFDTYILSTDNDGKYIEDKQLLTTVVAPGDAETITDLIHQECQRRVKIAVTEARKSGNSLIDVVPTVARFIPVVLSHHYLGVPAAAERGSFDLDDNMLTYYGDKVTGPDGSTPLPTSYSKPDGCTVDLPDSALHREDGIIPDEQQVYEWIVATFKHFFNNVQKDTEVQAYGVRAYRELLVYILREIGIQRDALLRDSDAVADNMLSRLLKIQMGLPLSSGAEPVVVDPSRVSDLRIAENVMGTIVGAVAGQEEATCRVVDSMIRLKEGDFAPAQDATPPDGLQYGDFKQARELALNILEGRDVANSRTELLKYVIEALRLQPQGEVLLRMCVKDGATIADSRPIRRGTLIFAGHGSAMQDLAQPAAFILGREDNNYLQYGYGRHKCLGQYVSPILLLEALVAILSLENVRRPSPRSGESAFPRERRFGRFQLDDENLYAKTFLLEFDDNGTS